jgi:hypothetical protein
MSSVSLAFVRRIAGLSAALLAASSVPNTVNAQSAAFTSASTTATVALPSDRADVPFSVGEELTYKASFGGLPAGTARMRVAAVELVRGRPAYHVVFTIDGGVPLFRVHDRYDSWIDVRTLSSLRYKQQISEGRYRRTTTYEIYPERAVYSQGDSTYASVGNPLDDGSFIYAIRALGIRVGETRRDDRYFRPDRNPVILTGVRTETVGVGAGSFRATVVKPSIKANGIFAESGSAHVWFSDDAFRYPVLVKSKFSKFSLTLELKSVIPGSTPVTVAVD